MIKPLTDSTGCPFPERIDSELARVEYNQALMEYTIEELIAELQEESHAS